MSYGEFYIEKVHRLLGSKGNVRIDSPKIKRRFEGYSPKGLVHIRDSSVESLNGFPGTSAISKSTRRLLHLNGYALRDFRQLSHEIQSPREPVLAWRTRLSTFGPTRTAQSTSHGLFHSLWFLVLAHLHLANCQFHVVPIWDALGCRRTGPCLEMGWSCSRHFRTRISGLLLL